MSVYVSAKKKGTGVHSCCLALCVCRGWVVGGGSHGAPQNWVRGINFLAWPIEANGRLAWEVSLPKQPLHPHPSARTGSQAARCVSHPRGWRNVCVEWCPYAVCTYTFCLTPGWPCVAIAMRGHCVTAAEVATRTCRCNIGQNKSFRCRHSYTEVHLTNIFLLSPVVSDLTYMTMCHLKGQINNTCFILHTVWKVEFKSYKLHPWLSQYIQGFLLQQSFWSGVTHSLCSLMLGCALLFIGGGEVTIHLPNQPAILETFPLS